MGRQGGKRQVGAARRRSRGHGLARLDGTRPRATVADKVIKSGKMDEQATAELCARAHASKARRPEAGKPGRRRQGCGRLAKASPVRDERGSEPGAARPDQGDAVGNHTKRQCKHDNRAMHHRCVRPDHIHTFASINDGVLADHQASIKLTAFESSKVPITYEQMRVRPLGSP